MHNQTKAEQNYKVQAEDHAIKATKEFQANNLHAITPGSDNERLAIAIFGEDWRERLEKNGKL